MTTTRCFSIPDMYDCTLVKAARNGDAFLAVGSGPGFFKSKFHYFSFECICEEHREKSKTPLVEGICYEKEFFNTGYIADFCDILNKNVIFYVTHEMSNKHELKCNSIVYNCTTEVHLKCAGRSERYIFSCASNRNGDTIVTGTEHGVGIFRDFMFSHEMAVNGYVGSIALDNSGNTVFCGINSSGLKVIDLRESCIRSRNSHFYGSMKVSDMKVLPSEKGIIVCGENEYLSLVDFRTFKEVLRYSVSRNVSLDRKGTISLDEDLDILCATGSDNVTRVWELSTGYLLHYICPPNPKEKSFGCVLTQENLFGGEADWFAAVLQNDVLFVVEPL